MHRFSRSHGGTWLTHLRMFHHAASSQLIQVSLACSCLSLWGSECGQINCKAMLVSGQWFYQSPYEQAGHGFPCPTALLLDGPRMLAGVAPAMGADHARSLPVIQLLRGTSREELLVLPPVWPICQRKAPQGCWCDWAGESLAAGWGFPKGVGKDASTPCSAWFISGLIRKGISYHVLINQTRSNNWRERERAGFLYSYCIPFYTKYFMGAGMWTMAIYTGKPDPPGYWVNLSIANSLWFS